VWTAQERRDALIEDLRRQVATFLFTERAFGDDPGVWHRFNRGGDVLVTALAGDYEGMNGGCWTLEHGNSMGEE
jgi:hypothetical protein